MKISIEQYEKLMRFIDLDMSAGEMKAFAEELDANPDLREQLDFEEQTREGFDTLYIGEDKERRVTADLTEDELRQIQIEMEEDEAKSKKEQTSFASPEDKKQEPATAIRIHKERVLKIDFSIAVAATLLIAVALVYLFTIGSPANNTVVKHTDTGRIKKRDDNMVKQPIDTVLPSPQKRTLDIASLFSSFYKKDTLPKQQPDIYASAFSDYNDNYYRTIQKIDAFNLPAVRDGGTELRNSKEYVATVGHYYTGLSFIETNNLREAIRDLQWVKDSADDKSYVVKAEWYLSLAYLKSGKADSAKQLLEKISTNNTVVSYQNKAKELLRKVE